MLSALPVALRAGGAGGRAWYLLSLCVWKQDFLVIHRAVQDADHRDLRIVDAVEDQISIVHQLAKATVFVTGQQPETPRHVCKSLATRDKFPYKSYAPIRVVISDNVAYVLEVHSGFIGNVDDHLARSSAIF
jgi:hypothetical protein